MSKKELQKIQSETEKFIAELGVSAEVKVTFDKEANFLNIHLDSEEAAVLIGFHGETLQAIQLMIFFLVHKCLERWMKVVVDVGDYRQKREEQLRKLALNLATKVKFSHEMQALPNLTASERRSIHLILADHPDVYTQSEGEGEERQLFIKPRAASK